MEEVDLGRVRRSRDFVSHIPLLDGSKGDVKIPRASETFHNSPSPSLRDTEEPGITSLHYPTQPGTLSYRSKLGHFALVVLVLGNVATLLCLGFITFLWFSDRENKTWRYIVVRGHLLTVVSAFSKGLETAMQTVLSVCSAIIAAILLECHETRLIDTAAVSMARYHGGLATSLLVLRKQLTIAPFGAPFLFGFATVAILIFSSTTTVLLNSDIGTMQLPGDVRRYSTIYSPNITRRYANNDTWRFNHGTTWIRRPSAFPVYGEYSEDPILIDGVRDTGVKLRSFLPYALPQSRLNMQDFWGLSTVLDTRVSCQAPVLENSNVSISSTGPTLIQLDSVLRPSKDVPGLFNRTLKASGTLDNITQLEWNSPVVANCLVSGFSPITQYRDARYARYDLPWRSSICQLPNGWNEVTQAYEYSGGLVSEFQADPVTVSDTLADAPWNSWKWGNAFLVLNITDGPNDIASDATSQSLPFTQSTRDEWTELSNRNLTLSVSLCYSSFMSADLPIRMTAEKPGYEAIPRYVSALGRYDFTTIRQFLGQANTPPAADSKVQARKHLQPQRQSWLATTAKELAPIEPYVRNAVNMWNYVSGFGAQTASRAVASNGNPIATHNGSISALMLQLELGQLSSSASGSTAAKAASIVSDPLISDLYQDIVTTGGTVAFALQALFTVMAANEYYDRLFLFDNADPAGAQYLFVEVNAPARRRGFLAVLVVTLLHTAVVAAVVARFLNTCEHTMLGNGSWRVLAQTVDAATADILAASARLDDDQLEAAMAARGDKHVTVQLETNADNRTPHLVHRRRANFVGSWLRPRRASSS